MTHYSNDDIATMVDDSMAFGRPDARRFADRLAVGDTLDYVDDGTGSGGYLEGCGDDMFWDDVRRLLGEWGMCLADVGGCRQVKQA